MNRDWCESLATVKLFLTRKGLTGQKSCLRDFNNNNSAFPAVKILLKCPHICLWVCVLIRVHDLDRLADHVHRQGGHSFGEDSCGSGFVSVLTPGTNMKGSIEQQKWSKNLGH